MKTIGQQGLLRQILYHALFWFLFILSEYLADYHHLQGDEHWRLLRAVLLSLPLLMLPTYFIVMYAVPRYLRKGKILGFIIILLASAAFVFYARIKWLELVNYINYDYIGAMPASKVIKNVIRDYSIIALAVSLYIISDWQRKERENKLLIEAKAKTDLELLKRQLHPHFLFNTLNNIYSLSLKNSSRTSESILKLSRLLEYLVYQTGEKQILLEKEIELVQYYVDLEKLRYGPELDVSMKVKGVNNEIFTAPLILLPFVENCFKHGGKDETGKFWVAIEVLVNSGKLIINVENSKNVYKGDRGKETQGVGLSNISERLELLYKDEYDLKIEDTKDKHSVRLEIELQVA